MESVFAKYAPSDKKKINLPYAASLVGAAGAAGSNNPAVLAMQKVFGYGGGSVPFELQTFADQARNGELKDIPEGFSSIKTAATRVLDEAPTFNLAMLTGLSSFEAMIAANQALKQDLKQNFQPKVQPQPAQPAQPFGSPGGLTTAEATAADTEALMTAKTEAATAAVVEADPTLVFHPAAGAYNAVEAAFDKETAAAVEVKLDEIAGEDKPGLPIDEVDGLVETSVGFASTVPYTRTTEESEWRKLIIGPGPVREWLNAQVNNLLDGPQYALVKPGENDAWWTELDPSTKEDLIQEVHRRVAVFRDWRSKGLNKSPSEPGGPWVPTDPAEVEAALIKEFKGEDKPLKYTGGPLSAYSALVDEHGAPLHRQIYSSLALHALPQSMRYMPHILGAIERRLPTMMGAWYLGGFLQDQPSTTGTPQAFGEANRFVNFVMRGGNPFDIGLTPKDTKDDFKKWVLASRTSLKDLEATRDAAGSPTNFMIRFELANPNGSAYNPSVERNILKAQAGWTGIGERGRMREVVLDWMENMHRRKRLMDPLYTEGLLAYASTWKGSPWYMPTKKVAYAGTLSE